MSAQATSETSSCNRRLLDVWESSHKQFLEDRNTSADTTAATRSIIVTITKPTTTALSSRKTPTRVQPPRKGKRKAIELEDTKLRVTVKRRKVTNVKGTTNTNPTSTINYHMPKSTFGGALHLSLSPDGDLHGKICHLDFRSFRNRLLAKVTSKMTGIYSRRAAKKNKARRCVLEGRETVSPWYKTGERTAQVFAKEAMAMGLPAAPEPDMLPSPSFANWPALAKSRTRMAKEDVEESVVEFEGLRFLVDVCGEPPVPRVMML
jgi:hypothetical protein